MTKEQFFSLHRENIDFVRELDSVLNTLRKFNGDVLYYHIILNQLNITLNDFDWKEHEKTTDKHKKLLDFLAKMNLVDKTISRHKDDDTTYQINISERFSKSLEDQLNSWKEEQEKINRPLITENYTNSNIIKNSLIQESQLQFESENAKQIKRAHTNQPNANETNNILNFLKKYWWAFLLPLLLIVIGLFIEYRYFNE